jgi:ribosomal-protein-alanine N-acetyltransferase
VIETVRLVLRPLESGDLDDYAAMYSDPEVMRFLGGVATRTEAAQRLDRRMRDYERQGYGVMAVLERETAAFVGRCGLTHWEIEGVDELEIGYAFARSAWGKGYATEAATAVRDYGLDALGVRRLVSLVAPENVRSAAVARKLGMSHERDVEFHGGLHRLYALNR